MPLVFVIFGCGSLFPPSVGVLAWVYFVGFPPPIVSIVSGILFCAHLEPQTVTCAAGVRAP